MTNPTPKPIRTIEIHGLRAAKRMISDMQAAMAADPLKRHSRAPFIRGQRNTLLMLSTQITERIAEIEKAVQDGTA